ncbi:hypothetical protein LSCM1_00982 [Leishmania martiniquensis]|uniref:Autophagy-related protein 2 n=1 Tax=Leishmania martiniquensis TaxID=1580590 RepID=A0A836KDG8_9TRYP|nr:hypothetical protein LSCM1_00982 [Leishmania martiniquensis]
MNFVNTYLLLPLQRKIFKNFGHYDYQTSTFHLNEERVNEVFFDPAYNPFVDVLRATSHASAVASSKAAAAAEQQRQHQRAFSPVTARGRNTTIDGTPGLRTTRAGSCQPCNEGVCNQAATVTVTEEAERGREFAASARCPPQVRLLRGGIRSAGLLSFLRQVTTQKSLTVESIDLVFEVTTATMADSTAASHGEDPSLVPPPASVPQDAAGDTAHREDDALLEDPAAAGLPALDEDEEVARGLQHLPTSGWPRCGEMAALARSYSIEDYSWLQGEAGDPGSSTDSAGVDSEDSDTEPQPLNAAGAARPGTPKDSSVTQFHSVGELMTYLKQQLQGLTVGVEDVRLTFCVPPAGARESLVDNTDSACRRSGRPHVGARAGAAGAPLHVCRGTRVLHLSCRRGLRLTVDESSGAAVEEMQCTASIQDWQCYAHVMKADGPLPSEFSLDDLFFATSATHTAGSAAKSMGVSAGNEREPAACAPITVRVARRGAGAAANAGANLPSLSPFSADAPLPPRVLVDVVAAEGWSIVLSAVQMANLVSMIRQVMSEATDYEKDAASTGHFSAFASTREPSSTTAEQEKQVSATPLDSGQAVTAAAMTATQLRAAAKYISVHCGGCSISLLTQSAVDANAVASAWRRALPSQQLALLDPRSTDPLQKLTAAPTLPVYEVLTTSHLTYVMREVDILFPNIDAEAPSPSSTSSPTVSGIFQQSARKRRIYRRIFDNRLADPSVTEQLARAHAAAGNSGSGAGASFFMGVGSISFLEYRHAAASARQCTAARSHSSSAANAGGQPSLSPLLGHSVRPAQLMHAERSPYALVLFHRSSPLLPQKAPVAEVVAQPQPPCFRIYQETVVVGVANISVQLDPGLVEALAIYGTAIEELIRRIGGAQQGCETEPYGTAEVPTGVTGSSTRTLSSPPLSAPSTSPRVHTRSSVKVLLESVDGSIRFPIEPNGTTASPEHPTDRAHGVSASTASTASASSEPQPFLLARLLQRLRDSSLDTHRHNRTLLRRLGRQARDDKDGVAASPATATPKPAEEASMTSMMAVQEQLGFPEDMDGRARFLPEFLRFSLRDLQVVHTPSTTEPARGSDRAAPAAVEYRPASTSVKWREAVVYLQDILEQTKSELFRVDYSREMNINVTHTRFPGLSRSPWRALERVLALHVRLGEIATTALTQDDYLLATYYVKVLLLTLSRCRQRLHAGRVAAAAREVAENAPAGGRASVAAVTAEELESPPVPDEAGVAPADVPDGSFSPNTSGGALWPSECREESLEHPAGSVAEAFAMADAQATSHGSLGERPGRHGLCTDPQEGASGHQSGGRGSSSGDGGDEAGSLRNAIPQLWRLLDTTCTSLDVHVSRIRLGLFAPRLSPMGQVVGEPLYRCLPRAQRRCLVDLNCLYHLYIMELLNVSVRGLSGDGALAKAGQANYLRVRCGGFSLWERQPAPPLTSRGRHEAGGVAGASLASMSSFYMSHASYSAGPGGAPPLPHWVGGCLHRDLAYYMSNAQEASTGHRRPNTLVQLVQSYTEVRGDKEEGGSGYHGDVNGETENDDDSSGQWASRSSRVLSEVWGAYVRELQSIRTTNEPSVNVPRPATRESGVCEVRLLETARVLPTEAAAHCHHTTPFASTAFTGAPVPPNRRYLWLQLTGLGFHHAVAYNGDHLGAVLKQYFSGEDGTVALAEPLVRDGEAARGMAEGLFTSVSTDEPLWTTRVHVVIVNLMATYSPRGAGRSLAVLLLPRASVVIKLPMIVPASPASEEPSGPFMLPEESRGGHAAAGSPASSLPPPAPAHVLVPLTMRARAWLHTSLTLYVSNDCDVEALVREVLNPAESDDWGVDLESAGFVRLCEVISTAASSSPSSVAADRQRSADGAGTPGMNNAASLSRTPNLLLTVRSRGVSASASGAHGEGGIREEGGSVDCSYLEPAVSIHLQHIELSAFMAKDSFQVFRDLVESWGSGADLEEAEVPAALVMRSGPGFEWVAEEVARSCAPMTFHVNPYLLARDRAADADASSGEFRSSSLGAPVMRAITSVDDYTSHYPLPPSTTSSQASRAFESPWAGPEKSQLGPSASFGGFNASYSAFRSCTSAYGYDHWLDALHASHGRDPQLYDIYQTRASQLLDGAPWVPLGQSIRPGTSTASGINQRGRRRDQSKSPLPASSAEPAPQPRLYTEVWDTISVASDDDVDLTGEEKVPAVAPARDVRDARRRAPFLSHQAPLPRASASAAAISLSSSFSDLEDVSMCGAQLQWCILPSKDSDASSMMPSGDAHECTAEAFSNAGGDGPHEAAEASIDLFVVCDQQPHFLSCWSRERVEAARQRRAVHLNRLDSTDDAFLHDTTEKYLYPPVEIEFFLGGCTLYFSFYEGTDLTSAASRKQRQGYMQTVSRGVSVAQATPKTFKGGRGSEAVSGARRRSTTRADTGKPSVTAYTVSSAHDTSHPQDGKTKLSVSRCSRATTVGTGAAWASHALSGESSASRLERLHDLGCRSGFGDRDASKRLVLCCRDITVQTDTFPQASEEDLWFRIVVGEVTVFDCISTSDVHRLLTATPKSPASHAAPPRRGSGGGHCHADMSGVKAGGSGSHGGATDARHLELTGLLTSSKSVHVAANGGMSGVSRASFAVSHFQQGGSEFSLAIRLQPTSLTWSGASVDFMQTFFSVTASPPSSPGNSIGTATMASSVPPVLAKEAGTISGTEAPPLFYRRVVILPTTLTAAGSFQSEKGVLAALAEGSSLDALRSIPVLSWISLREIPLPIPFIRVEDCSSATTLLQRIVEDSNCVSIRFLLTACCCGLQPLSAVTRVGEAAKGLLLLPLSNYRGAALHHAIRTASSVFMQELLTQASDMAALLASGSYHASRSLLEVLVSPQHRALNIEEPSRAAQPAGVADGWRQGQEQLRVGLQEALTMASYCTGPDGSLLRIPAAALRLLMGISGAATTTLWGVRNSQGSAARERDCHIYKKKS